MNNLRALFNKVKEATAATPILSTLRLEQLMDNAKGLYSFYIKQNSGSVLPMEIRLQENDTFYIAATRLLIKQEEPASPGSALYQTYCNQTAINLNAGEIVAGDVESIWNSTLNININTKDELKNFDMKNSRMVPTTQQSATTNRSGIKPMDGFIETAGLVKISGTDTVNITLNSPAYAGKLAQRTTGTARNYVAIELLGFLVVGNSKLGRLD